jgi:spore coat polysaccharide biosynthesis predicted glycosyltransferase SpsG
MKKKIGIIYQKSNKIGYGHYVRSLRLAKILKKKYIVNCIELKKNSEILSKIRKKKYNLHLFDLKNYSKKIYKLKNVLVFENINQKLKKIISINPLDNDLPNSGPEYFIYPESFKNKKKKFEFLKKKLNILVVHGRNDSNNQLKKLIKILIFNKKKIQFDFTINVKVKKSFNIKKNNLIKFLPTFKNEYDIYKNIDLAISGVGNTAYELGYLGIPTIHFSAEKREVNRAKFFHKKKLAPYIAPGKTKFIINELNKFYINDKYRKKIIYNRIRFFKRNNKISKFINEII